MNNTITFATPPHNLSENDFVATFGGVYEHSPWIAEQTWQAGLSSSYDTPAGLSAAMQKIVNAASKEQLLTLIKAHPDLAGKVAIQGELTAESSAEQAGAGINECTPEEFARFQRYNNAYKEKFGFPFIMAVKGSNRHLILAAFEERLENDVDTEFARAIREIHKIARFRLDVIAAGE